MTIAGFTSPPLANPYEISGPIVADLWISSPRPDTTLTVTVGDVQPDNSVFRVTAGSLVGSLAALGTTRCGNRFMDCSVYSGKVPIVPWHPYTRASQVPLTSSPTEVRVEVFPTNAVFEPGHRLRIALTTGDFPHQGPNLSTLANSTGGVTTLYFDAAHPSRVYVGAVQPVTAGAAGAATRPAAAGSSTSTGAGQTVRARSAPRSTPTTAGLRNTASRVPVFVPLAGALLVLCAVCAAAVMRRRRRVRSDI